MVPSKVDKATVFVVDDDAAVCDALRWLIESIGMTVETFNSAESFLRENNGFRTGCLVLDVRMPGMSGLAVQEALAEAETQLPVIMISGHADVPIAVQAMKLGAVDFIEKPFSDDLLLDRIQQAVTQDRRDKRILKRRREVADKLKHLTDREREVLGLVVAGKVSKEVAAELKISLKTVEVHRSHMMEKMQVIGVAELICEALVVLPNPALDGSLS